MTALALTVLCAGALAAEAPASSSRDAVVLEDYAPCGLTSLHLVCQLRQTPVSWEAVQGLVSAPGPKGELSFADLARVAAQLGMHPVGLEVSRAGLRDLPMPCIMQVADHRYPDEVPHFLILLRPEADGVWLLDAPYAPHFLPDSRLQQCWTGRVMVFAQDEEEAGRLQAIGSHSSALRWGGWVSMMAGALLCFFLLIRAGVQRGFPRWTLLPTLTVLPRKALLLLLAAGVAVAITWVIVHLCTPFPPQCAFDEPVVQLGELSPGGHTVRVPINNPGDLPLHILELSSSCTCAVAKYPAIVEPRQSDEIEVQLNVVPGPLAAQLTIVSDDPSGPKHVFLSWHGKAKPMLLPRWVNNPDAPLDRPYERVVKVLYPGGKSALVPRLEGYQCDAGSVTLREGENNPMALRLGRSGLLTDVQGELDLHLEIQPPPSPGPLRTICELSLRYGKVVETVNLPIQVDFLDASRRATSVP